MAKAFPQIRNDRGLLVVEGTEPMQPLNYLMHFPERGFYEPNFGLCPPGIVTKEVADEHNRLLDSMLVTGLDESCKVGQGGMFYFSKNEETGKHKVATFMGTIISDNVRDVNSRFYFFNRKGKEFRGSIRKDDELTFVKRIS